MMPHKLARWLGGLACVLALCTSCKDTKQGEGTDQANVEETDPAALEGGEKDLLARRDSLLSTRQRIRNERADLFEKRRLVREKGGDTTELDAQAAKLIEEERELSEEEDALNQRLDAFLSERRDLVRQLAAQATSQNRAAATQGLMASREKDLAGREAKLADREAKVAAREAALAKREKETCGAAAPTIIQTVDAKGSKYTKSDVEPMLKQARRAMSKKGILPSDLPSGVRELEDEATKAMAKADYGRAHFAANQLLRLVRGMRIDKGFIAAKIGRLNVVIKGKKLDSSKDAEVSKLFRQATENFGDGRYKSANSKLNRIYSAIR